MKVKALRKISTKDFIHIEYLGGRERIFVSELPKVQPESATLYAMKKLYEKKSIEIDWDDIELVEFELVETNNSERYKP